MPGTATRHRRCSPTTSRPSGRTPTPTTRCSTRYRAMHGDRADRRRRPEGAVGDVGPRLRRPGHHVLPGLLLRRGPGGDVLRARGLDDEPRQHVQRGAADPAHRLQAERDRHPGRDHPGHPALPLLRLLGHRGHRVDLHAPHKELAVVATSVVETADSQPPVDGTPRAALGATTSATGTPRCWTSPATSDGTRSWRRSRGCCAGDDAGRRGARGVPVGARAPDLPARDDGRAHLGGGGVGGRARGVPGLRAPHAAAAARGRRAGPVRLGLPAARRPRAGPADGHRREARLDRGVDGRLVGLRPDQPDRDREPARLGRHRPRLRRRPRR